ncbi:unnamed protein product [Bursaphelenchus xylophilus]|uniref:(pine wood nematode) hypothetical protein n=1 Tax=Bursaphelenchus xylophilus TaxID=6326 RepID=A0A1I7SD22_BURXY|nr:unnamed protein product [Bursaphelenchus xylophilus]CAG9093073.1 unnamed protein product [Bursaphelenchus xylophilus]
MEEPSRDKLGVYEVVIYLAVIKSPYVTKDVDSKSTDVSLPHTPIMRQPVEVDPNVMAGIVSYLARNPLEDDDAALRPENQKITLVPPYRVSV